MTEQKLRELLRDMSLEEKVNQMSQVVGDFFNGETVATGPMADKGFTENNVNLAGSVIGALGAETLKNIQEKYMKKHPHHIPLLFMLDVISRLHRELHLNRNYQNGVHLRQQRRLRSAVSM